MSVRRVEITSFAEEKEAYKDCFVNIRGVDITFEYKWKEEPYVFTGFECPDSPGRYELFCPKRDSRITLFRLPGTDRLVGPWSECVDGVAASGFWDIEFLDGEETEDGAG